jgi:hypothetical protein
MEPNKLETQFKEKLNSREILPNEMAWDRLDAMLSVTEEKKTKRSFGWLYIAASILVLVTAGTFFFNQKDTEVTPTNTVVVRENDTVAKPITKFQTPANQEQKQSEVVISSVNAIIKQQQEIKINQSIINQKANTIQNQIIKDKVIEYQNTEVIALKNLPRIQNRKAIVVENEVILKADELLVANLDNGINQSSIQKPTVKVNAKSLLSQVDGELEQSFRETRLEKIQRNFKTVKVALANRNNQ